MAFAVRPYGFPSTSRVVITVTPVAKCPMTRRSSARSIDMRSLRYPGDLPSRSVLLQIAGVDHVAERGGWGGGRGGREHACGMRAPRPPPPAPDPTSSQHRTPTPSPTPAFAWANGSEYALVVRKEERTLTVYHRSEQMKVYPIVLGIASYGPKVYQGDLRTPEGVYRISSKRPHARWSRFMLLSYPNDQDRDRYAMALSEGRVPIIDGHAPASAAPSESTAPIARTRMYAATTGRGGASRS